MIGCDVSWKCAVACLFGELSQQPIFPQLWHMRRCTHQPPVFRQSSQPAISAGTFVTWISSRCVQLTSPVWRAGCGLCRRAHALEPVEDELEPELEVARAVAQRAVHVLVHVLVQVWVLVGRK